MPIVLDQFVQWLADSGLMTTEATEALVESLPPEERPGTAEDLARLLYRRGRLTKYQAQAIYRGKTKGLVLGNYIVVDEIGQGGMGNVYRARHRRMKREVAVKVISPALVKSQEALQRFEREVEAAAKLNHPNIVTAHDADESDGVRFLAMEYVDGIDLSEIVRQQGPLPVAAAIDYVLQAAKGLEYAHENGVIHRDIKPSNLLLDSGGTVKILDMGLARVEQELHPETSAKESLTKTGQMMGTADYMSPEQAVDARHVDRRGDIYSLGCTLFCLLTGRTVYEGDTLTERLLAHRLQPIPSLCQSREDVPTALDEVFQRMIAKSADDRYQSISEAIAHLETCHSRLRGEAGPSPPPAPPPVSRRQGERSAADQPACTSGNGPLSSTLLRDATTIGSPVRRIRPIGKTPRSRRPIITVWHVGCLLILLLVLGVVVIDPLKGMVVIRVDEPNAEVSIDDGKIRLTTSEEAEPIEVRLPHGNHRLAITKDGFEPLIMGLYVSPGRTRTVWIELEPLPAELPAKVAEAKEGLPDAPPVVTSPSEHDEPKQDNHDTGPKEPVGPQPDDTPPPLASAPFDSDNAREHQQRWAERLNVPVEITNSIGMKLALIPPGEFMMGSTQKEIEYLVEEANELNLGDWYKSKLPGEGPQRRVRITQPFCLGVYEVTQEQYQRVIGTNPSKRKSPKRPVEMVSWNDAIEFCRKLSELAGEKAAGRVYRLPTEAEWEYACRAGTTTRYWFGDSEAHLGDYAWYKDNCEDTTHPVGWKSPNAWGLYDMHGNVYEWCADRYDEDRHAASPAENATEPAAGSSRVARGGCSESAPTTCRSAFRTASASDYRDHDLGFRVVLVLPGNSISESDSITGPEALEETDLTREKAGSAKVTSPNRKPKRSSAKTARSKPPPALAPFDARRAKQHQEAWADYLGVPMEMTNSIGMKLVLIPAGEFLMGSADSDDKALSDEKPQHAVRITKPFYLGVTEVTQGHWESVMSTRPWEGQRRAKGGSERAATYVNWEDAVEFCRRLSEKEGATYRLPTEAEREYTCRAGTTTIYHFGSDNSALKAFAWFDARSWESHAHRVGEKKAKSVRPIRHARQRMGVVFRLVR